MAGTRGYVRWVPAEWLRVAVNMLPMLDKGMSRLDALHRSQRLCLQKDRWRPDDALTHAAAAGNAQSNKYLEAARKLSDEERSKLLAPKPERKPQPPRPSQDEGRDYNNGTVRWTTREKALLARRVRYWQVDLKDTRALSRLIIEAQEIELPPERRRPIPSIQAGTTAGHNERAMKEGWNNQILLEGMPFIHDPGRKQEEILEVVTSSVKAATSHSVAAPAAPEAAGASEAPAAPKPSPTHADALSEASRAFGETVMGALDTLLHKHAELMLGHFYAKLSVHASETAAQVGALIERGLKDAVHRMVEQELGGPVSPPPSGDAPAPVVPLAQAAQAPEPAPPPPPPAPPRLKVDVVGFNIGADEQRVRAAFNGNTDLRFFTPDAQATYAPHRGRHLIMLTQRVPHSLRAKIKACGVEPVYVRSTVGHVIHAIEELHRAEGVPLESASAH